MSAGVNESRMGTERIGRLMVSMAVPSIIAQIINILYNIVDRIYIGHIPGVGAAALTGVGITFPIITLISAFSAFVGMGERRWRLSGWERGTGSMRKKYWGAAPVFWLFLQLF
ncbi:MATE family efflux transporter [Eisenbergiella porci]|uniref:MATE family efflux transporter n=1 Tax=Eisenbergiella porci TaxID=2652274 RepID=UPI0022A7ABF5|nr:MATE family efflux transporter [Eisenbergiella porci]